jgi:DNA invertase Pin-like site-specific DNA recombinase
MRRRARVEARGVAFVSLRDNLDLCTPSGRLMFKVIGALAEFERALIQERVKAGLRNARAKGKRLGRPKIAVDGRQVTALRKAGSSWSEVLPLNYARSLYLIVPKNWCSVQRLSESASMSACRRRYRCG